MMNRMMFMKGLFAASVLGGSAGCSAADETKKTVDLAGKKAAIVVYSWAGNTRAVAEAIKAATGAELIAIKPKTPYPESYRAVVDQAKAEIAKNFEPELASVPDVSAYDVLYIGSPNWWGTMAPPMRSFLKQAKLEGKVIRPFMTHGGGGRQRVFRDIEAIAKERGATTVTDGLCLSGSWGQNASESKPNEVDAKKVAAWVAAK